MPRYGSIYKITNMVNGKVYVGQTIQPVGRRWNSHGRGRWMLVGAAIKKYGRKNFKFEELASCFDREGLDQLERHFIATYKSNDKAYGYNLTPGGYGRRSTPHAVSTCLKTSASHAALKAKTKVWRPKTDRPSWKRKPVVGVSLVTGEHIAYGFIRDTERDGFSSTKVTECCQGKRRVHKGFMWSYQGGDLRG